MPKYQCQNPDCPKPNREFVRYRPQPYCGTDCLKMVYGKTIVRNHIIFETLDRMLSDGACGEPELKKEVMDELKQRYIPLEKFWNKVMKNVSNGVYDAVASKNDYVPLMLGVQSREEVQKRRQRYISTAREFFQICILELRMGN